MRSGGPRVPSPPQPAPMAATMTAPPGESSNPGHDARTHAAYNVSRPTEVAPLGPPRRRRRALYITGAAAAAVVIALGALLAVHPWSHPTVAQPTGVTLGTETADASGTDYSMAISLNSENGSAYAGRGLAYLYRGNPAEALADLTKASELDPKSVEDALWVDIVRQRSNLPSRLAEAAAKIDMKAWPAPLIRMFLGQMTPAAVFLVADDPDADKKRVQACVANFYTGELALRTGGKSDAVRLFRLAQSGCPHDVTAWSAANAELKALGGGR